MMSGKPTSSPVVSGSLSATTPSTTATAVLRYVTTTVRDGPISLMSSKKTRNPTAVIPTSPTIAHAAVAERCAGRCVAP